MSAVRERILAEYIRYTQPEQYEPQAKNYLFDFMLERLKAIGIRSYFTFAASEYIKAQMKQESIFESGTNDVLLFNTQLPLIAEWLMGIMYLQNHILDFKHNVRSSNGMVNFDIVHKKLIASHYQKDLLYGYIRDSVLTDQPAENRLVQETVQNILNMVDMAQFWDKRNSSFAHFSGKKEVLTRLNSKADAFIQEMLYQPDTSGTTLMDWLWQRSLEYGVKSSKKRVTEQYFKRVCLENGTLFVKMADLVAALLHHEGSTKEELRRFAIRYAIMSQLVNDNVDTLPSHYEEATVGKTPKDSTCDLKNNNITWILIAYFSMNTNKNRNELLTLYQQSEQDLFNEIKDTVKKCGYPFGKQLAKLARLQLNKANNYFDNVADLASFAYSPRRYKYFL